MDDKVPVFESQIGDNIQIQVREGCDECSSASGELSDSRILIGQTFDAGRRADGGRGSLGKVHGCEPSS
jgi:hypothetical protein